MKIQKCSKPWHHDEGYDSCASSQEPLRVEQATCRVSINSSWLGQRPMTHKQQFKF